jgi:hypothetical protein
VLRFRLFAWLPVAASLLVGCGGGGGGDAASSAASRPAGNSVPDPAPPGDTRFVDATGTSGINYELAFSLPDTNAMRQITFGGAAAGDYDGDGDIDVFIVRGDAAPNLLYENVGDLTFVEVAAEAGLAYTRSTTENYAHGGPVFADVDGDGDLDLFLGGLHGDPSLIFENNGDKTFTNVTAGSGIDGLSAEENISAAFGDYDLDGDLDLFVTHYNTERPQGDPGDTEHLWRNDSDASGIRFTSVSEQALISPSVLTKHDGSVGGADWSYTPTFARINGDLYPDILVVADYGTTQVFMNNGDGTFTNVTSTNITDDNGMGSAVGDYDDDGDLDWFVTSILQQPTQPGAPKPPGAPPSGNRLYRNQSGVFVDATEGAGVRDGGWGWAACMFDFENDGDLDIYHTNGWGFLDPRGVFREDASRAFVSDGAGHFENRAEALGLADTNNARGAVCADFDDDGDIDILQLHEASGLAATLWKNDGSVNNYLRVKLKGLPPNTEGAGARIKARIGSITRMREVTIGNNYSSQNPTVQIIGLGSAAQVDELTIEWPDAATPPTVLNDVAANQTLTVPHPGL